MINNYITTKKGMTQVWDETGKRLPATVLVAEPLVVTQVKTEENDKYQAVQVGYKNQKQERLNKPFKGHLKKLKTKTPPGSLREVLVGGDNELEVGDVITVDQVLKQGDRVQVQGTSKGRGFTGVMKRWKFSGGQRTHGQSDRERAPGSIGQGTDPGRVHKGKKMPGRHGGAKVTVRNLTVLKIDKENSEVLVSGPVPGSINSEVLVTVVGENKKFAGLFDESRIGDEKGEKKVEVKKKEAADVKKMDSSEKLAADKEDINLGKTGDKSKQKTEKKEKEVRASK